VHDFTDLKLISLIPEEPSLSAVALRVKMSLPAVSQRLAKLETRLRVKLVYRSGRFGLTPEGEIFLSSANTILDELERLQSRLKDFQESRTELLRIACADAILLSHLPPVLKHFAQEHPAIALNIVEVPHETAYQRLASDEADIVLVPEGLYRDQTKVVQYKTERICLIAPLIHPIGQEVRPIYASAAQRFDFIGLSDETKHIEKLCELNGIQLNYKVRAPSTEAHGQLVGQAFNGLALTYESTARRHARTQPITVIRLLDDWAKVPFVAATMRQPASSPSAKLFLQALLTHHSG